ncbi:mycofactocin biosynthesis chaperone MftB [Desulfococcus sp.]|uniref:mycofactocin biosynthesis chaperone MftB n=1 Tax=Desulfococcus sp. TaxID=2025834 RepID=UPI003593D693
MHLDSVYRLAEGVQVRNEVFGLLFYDYRGPRLYFVPSKNLITDAFFEGRQRVADLLDILCAEMPWPRKWIQDQVEQVLEKLERKGLIHGQSVC